MKRNVTFVILAAIALFCFAVFTLQAQDSPVWDGSMSWPFEPPKDTFSDKAVLDLRFLNEKESGQHGFIRLSKDGNSFVRGDGEPIRFFAVGTSVWQHQRVRKGKTELVNSAEDMDRHCRFLAKLGVNMVRIHTEFADYSKGAAIDEPDKMKIDSVHRFMAAAKRHGIYVTICPYWGYGTAPTSWGLDGYTGKEKPLGALFFNPKLQNAYKNWMRKLYAEANPHTGIPLKDDPTLAMIQTVNEDSLLFWTVDKMPEPQQRLLDKFYAEWLIKRHGSLEAALKAWEGAAAKGDDVANGRLARLPMWELTRDQSGGKARRVQDQLTFIAETQRTFYADMYAFYRNELGMKCLINASNWKTASERHLKDVERWTYTATDVMAQNDYAGNVTVVGKNRGYRIDPGYLIAGGTAMHDPTSIPTNRKQVFGHPMVITETTWSHPTEYQAEGPFLLSAYQSLSGVDTVYWFMAGSQSWDLDPRQKFWRVGPGDTRYALRKASCLEPCLAGMFPAAALLYRRGYLQQAEPAVIERRTLADLFDRQAPAIAEKTGFDSFRDTGNPGGGLDGGETAVDRLAYLVGPVMTELDADHAEVKTIDLSRYIDRENQVVRAGTGQLVWDAKRRVCTMDAPKAQGVTGFLAEAGGTFKLSTVQIDSANTYAAVTVVALDDKALSGSGRILVQVGTRSRLTQWEQEPANVTGRDKKTMPGYKILQTGKPPWQVLDTKVTLNITNPGLSKATRLDVAGYRAESVPVRRDGNHLQIKLPPNTMYLILE